MGGAGYTQASYVGSALRAKQWETSALKRATPQVRLGRVAPLVRSP